MRSETLRTDNLDDWIEVMLMNGQVLVNVVRLLVGLLMLGGSAVAGIISYTVSLNTSPIIGHAAAPFSLNFQFTDGQGTGDTNNTVTLANFAFGTGGAAAGVPSLFGGASGSLATGVSMTDSAFLSSFTQQFVPGTNLTFMLQLTTNVDPGLQPDEFSLAILDNSGFEIPTLGPANALIILDINSPSPTAQSFATDASSSPFGGGGPINMAAAQVTPTTGTVPEPNSFVMLFMAFASLLLWDFVAKLKKHGSS